MSPRYSETKVGNSVIPAGDPAEQFMANLMLAVLAFHSDDTDIGQKHLNYAHSIAADLERLARTYRSKIPMKVIGITSRTDDQEATLMVPVVGERLVVPGMDLQRIAKRLKSQSAGQSTISLQALNIHYHDLRFRPARLVRALAAIMELDTANSLLTQAEGLLTRCLADKHGTVDAIELAHDYLRLTHEFSSIRNFLLAGMALQQATQAIDELVRSDNELGNLKSVTEFRARVQVLASELRAGDA